jgi:REP element-mobilizing transposase RayT
MISNFLDFSIRYDNKKIKNPNKQDLFKQKLKNWISTMRFPPNAKKHDTLWRIMEKREIWQGAFYACHFNQHGLNFFAKRGSI